MQSMESTVQPVEVGSIVRLPDGQIAQVTAVECDVLDVVQSDRSLGRGPWTFHRSQVELADPDAAHRYSRACHMRRQRIPVIGAGADGRS